MVRKETSIAEKTIKIFLHEDSMVENQIFGLKNIFYC